MVIQRWVLAQIQFPVLLVDSLNDTTDIDPQTGNPAASGDVVTVTNKASNHSACTFGFKIGSNDLTVHTLSGFSGRPDIVAWESDADLSGSPADISQGSNLVNDLVTTWYFKITNSAAYDGGTATSGETVTVTQSIDGSVAATVTFTVA